MHIWTISNCMMYSGKRRWGKYDIRQGSRIPSAPPSQMVASLQGHYSCITAYMSRGRVPFICIQHIYRIYEAIYSEHIKNIYTKRFTAYTTFRERHMAAALYFLVEGVCSSAVKVVTSYQMTALTVQQEYLSWILQMNHWIIGEDFDNTKAPFRIMRQYC